MLQTRMPSQLTEGLAQVAADTSLPLTDLGAYYLIRGWNQNRVEQGLEPVPMPEYLEQEVGPKVSVERVRTLIDEAEESRLAG